MWEGWLGELGETRLDEALFLLVLDRPPLKKKTVGPTSCCNSRATSRRERRVAVGAQTQGAPPSRLKAVAVGVCRDALSKKKRESARPMEERIDSTSGFILGT